jgi:thioredoxin-related protein
MGYFLTHLAGVAAILAAAGADGATLAAPIDLHADGAVAAARGRPLIVLFSLPDCHYCEVVRRNYLAPLAALPHEAQRPVVRELELTATAPIAGFRGDKTSGAALASKYGVRFAPTVVMLDRDGVLLAPPLVGGDVAGMYGAYLDRALGEAQAKLSAVDPKPNNSGKQ